MQKSIYAEWNCECYFSYGTSNSRAVAFLFGRSIGYKIKNTIIDENGNYIILDMTICDKKPHTCKHFGPNSDQPQFYEEIFNNVRKISNEFCIICWDYNSGH
jgi:hypothetical protein